MKIPLWAVSCNLVPSQHHIFGAIKKLTEVWTHLHFSLHCPSFIHLLCHLPLAAGDAARHLIDRLCCLCSWHLPLHMRSSAHHVLELWYQLWQFKQREWQHSCESSIKVSRWTMAAATSIPSVIWHVDILIVAPKLNIMLYLHTLHGSSCQVIQEVKLDASELQFYISSVTWSPKPVGGLLN